MARAETLKLSVPATAINWSAGTVTLSADYPAGTKSVVFWEGRRQLASVGVADSNFAGTVSSGVPFALKSVTAFSAEARNSEGAVLGETVMLSLDPATFTPAVPRLALAAGALIEPSLTLEASSDHKATAVTVRAGPEPLTHPVIAVTGAGGQITVSGVRVPYGVEWIKLTASNGFGSSLPSTARSVYNLGPKDKLPKQSRYVLVDKRSMTLYEVHQNRVLRHYDIAIGTPSTPTPNGYFKIGAARPSSGVWGSLRRPLYRFSHSRLRPTRFYIHGTDAPWDIGTWASHGCVRMYDWAIKEFSKTVPSGTVVLIRP